MEEGGKNDISKHPRLDSLQALLRFAIQQTKSEDAPNESAFEQMDPERRQFLENALKSLTVDIIEELEKAIKTLDSPETSVDEKLNALELIEELASDIDLANNFLKIGGSNIIVKCLEAEDPRIKTTAVEIVGEIAQNNPFAQGHFAEIDMIPKLILLLKNENPNVVKSAMHAVSCLVRRFEPALAIFIEKDGLETILDCFKRENVEEKLLAKTSFLVDSLSIEFAEVRDQFIKLGGVEILAQVLVKSLQQFDGSYSAKMEHLLSALKTLSESSKIKDKLKEVENIQSTLKHILSLCQSKEECQEISNYSQQLLNHLTNNNVTTETVLRPGASNMQVSICHERSNLLN